MTSERFTKEAREMLGRRVYIKTSSGDMTLAQDGVVESMMVNAHGEWLTVRLEKSGLRARVRLSRVHPIPEAQA